MLRRDRHQPLCCVEGEPVLTANQRADFALEHRDLVFAIEALDLEQPRRRGGLIQLSQQLCPHSSGSDRLLNGIECRSGQARDLHDTALGVERQLVLATDDGTDRGTKHPNFVLTIQALNLEA